MRSVNLRISDKQIRELDELVEKLSVDRSNLIRLAIARFVEAEGRAEPRPSE